MLTERLFIPRGIVQELACPGRHCGEASRGMFMFITRTTACDDEKNIAKWFPRYMVQT